MTAIVAAAIVIAYACVAGGTGLVAFFAVTWRGPQPLTKGDYQIAVGIGLVWPVTLLPVLFIAACIGIGSFIGGRRGAK